MGEQYEEADSVPLIVCASRGGEYDDGAFSAGIQLGQIDAILTLEHPLRYSTYVLAGICPQLDLIAMHHGYLFKSEPIEDQVPEGTPEDVLWAKATFALTS